MSEAVFQQCLKFTLNWEGGFVDNPVDPGGATNHGITQATYDSYRRFKKLPPNNVRGITMPEVADIYREMFWEPSYGYLFTSGLSLALFDTLVQFSPISFSKFIQRALGAPNGSLYWNLKTCNQQQTALNLCDVRLAYREERVKEDPSQIQFLDGWKRRDNALKQAVISWKTPAGALD